MFGRSVNGKRAGISGLLPEPVKAGAAAFSDVQERDRGGQMNRTGWAAALAAVLGIALAGVIGYMVWHSAGHSGRYVLPYVEWISGKILEDHSRRNPIRFGKCSGFSRIPGFLYCL